MGEVTDPRVLEAENEAYVALAKLSEVYKFLGDKRQYKVNTLIRNLDNIRGWWHGRAK